MSSLTRNQEIAAPSKIGPYILSEQIGFGSTSSTRKAINTLTQQSYACKIVPKKQFKKESQKRHFQTEIATMLECAHPNILSLLDFTEDSINFYVVSELCPNGDLSQQLIRHGPYHEMRAKALFKQICEGMSYMHLKGIAHRDLKPENILLDNDFNPKICDFGLSIKSTEELCSTQCGTLVYAPPEMLNGKDYDPFQADVWSCGVLLYAILTGRLPWKSHNQNTTISEIKAGNIVYPINLGAQSTDLLSKLLNLKPELRISFDQALSHPWLSDAKSRSMCQSLSTSSLLLDKSMVKNVFETFNTKVTQSQLLRTREIYDVLKESKRIPNKSVHLKQK